MALTPEQRAEADRLYEHPRAATDADLRALAGLLAAEADGESFGRTEFEVRDRVHGIGAKALEGALAGRKKGGPSGAASLAGPAAGRPGSSATRPGGSGARAARCGTSGRTTPAATAGPGPARPTPPCTWARPS